MEIITQKIDEIVDIPKNYCVFDIETTGLSPKYNKVILIGILYMKHNQTLIQQFFAQNSSQEKEILFYFKEIFKEFEGHITFNGISFDIPFLNERFIKNNLDFQINKEKDIDIMRIVRPHKNKLNLEDCKLKTIEKLIGIERKDNISGKESVELYKKYELNKNEDLKKKILLHNYEDIYYLGKLFKVTNLIDSKENFIEIKFLDNINKLKLYNYKFKKENLLLEYILEKPLPVNIEIYEGDYTILGNDKKININLNISRGIDSNGHDISYFKIENIIPLKIENHIIEDNIHLIGDYLFKNNF